MPEDIRLWAISENDELIEMPKESLAVEERLEKWLEKDISVLSEDLLLLGRQIETDFGGVIDLFCIDRQGDTVIVELKRDKTPREVTAQVIDYASWVKDLSGEQIKAIAEKNLGDNGSLEKIFKEKFGDELPNVLNENHRMIVVGSQIDSSSERIINYLSETYGVAINAATFQYYKDKEGKEFLARVFLVEIEEQERRTARTTKRLPPLSEEELQEIADRNGVGELYRKIVINLSKIFNSFGRTRTTLFFIGIMGDKKSRNTIFSLLPIDSGNDIGVSYKVYINRMADYFNLPVEQLREILPNYRQIRFHDDWAGEEGMGYIRNEEELQALISDISLK